MSAKKSKGAHESKKRGKMSPLAVIVMCIVAVMLILVATVLILYFSGRSALTDRSKNESVPVIEADPQDTGHSDNSDTLLDTFTIRKNGKLYKPRDNMITLLALGVDESSPDDVGGIEYLSDARADMIMLAAIDMDTGKLSFITLSRDTICNFDMYDTEGNYTGQGTGQIALSFRYGDGKQKSCIVTRNAVSEIFGGINIKGCAALYLDGVSALNDAVGGVTVTIDDDYSYKYSSMKNGETVTLDGNMAEYYIRTREHTESGNLERMSRQKQYFKALLKQMISAGKENLGNILTFYNAVSDYVVTDISVNELTYLASQILKLDLSAEFYNVPGEVTLSEDNYAEYFIDQKGLTQILLDVYYEEITE